MPSKEEMQNAGKALEAMIDIMVIMNGNGGNEEVVKLIQQMNEPVSKAIIAMMVSELSYHRAKNGKPKMTLPDLNDDGSLKNKGKFDSPSSSIWSPGATRKHMESED